MRKKGTDIQNELYKLSEKGKKLSEHQVIVGIQDQPGKNVHGATVSASSEVLMVAHVQEFGQAIGAKGGKKLAIPISGKSIGKSPGDFGDLFVLPRKNKGTLLARKANNQYGFEPLFVLKDSVTIPARPFISKGFQEIKSGKQGEVFKAAVNTYLNDKISLDDLVEQVGERCVEITVGRLQAAKPKISSKYASNKQEAGYSPQTLTMTGAMQNHITYRKD